MAEQNPSTSTDLQTTPPPRLQKRIETLLERALLVDWYQETLQRFLGTPEAVNAFTAEIFSQARKAPKLYVCTLDSTRFILAQVASLKLNPAIPNEVSLIARSLKQTNGKYADEMTVIYGYAGLRKLAMRSPEVVDILTAAVCANDLYVPASNAIMLPLHRLPDAFAPRGRVIGYYAAVQLSNGNWRTWPMSVTEVEAHAKRYVGDLTRAPAWSRGTRPDVEDGLTPFDKMALKTCLRMLLNGRDVPLSVEVVQALQHETVALHVETAAERQGYDPTTGHRPALGMGTGQTLEDLLGDLQGDQAAVQAALARERQPIPVDAKKDKEHRDIWKAAAEDHVETGEDGQWENASSHGLQNSGHSDANQGHSRQSAWRDTLEAHKDDMRLQEGLLAQVSVALDPGSKTSDAAGLALAGAVLDCLHAPETYP